MHPHHARALHIARRNFRFAKAVVADRERFLVACRNCYRKTPTDYFFMQVKVAVEKLHTAVNDLEEALSVVVTVERMLEKA